MAFQQQNKLLITGATGFIGQRITRKIAESLPQVQILAASRKTPERNDYIFPKMAKMPNLRFIQYDCTETQTLPLEELSECRAVMHLVGGLRQSHMITRLCQGIFEDRNFMEKMHKAKLSKELNQLVGLFHTTGSYYYKAQKKRSEIQISQNYESTVNIADQFQVVCSEQDRIGELIFMSADPSIFSENQAARFSHLKERAELYLIDECPNIRPVILRPGKVYAGNQIERAIEYVHNRPNYTHMDDVCRTLFSEVERIYEGVEAQKQDQPLLISAERIKHEGQQ